MQRKLYGYFRSSAAYRVRIAMNLKMLEVAHVAVDLKGGEQRTEAYRAKNAIGLVPALEIGDDIVLGQSLAILEYLEEAHPEPPLLPVEPLERARVRQLALIVACEVHPLNNLAVLGYLKDQLGVQQQGIDRWYREWIARGFQALERMLDDPQTGDFCHGDAPTFADVCLVPQVYNARRFDCDLAPYPLLCRIEQAALEHPAFRDAAPEVQSDAPAAWRKGQLPTASSSGSTTCSRGRSVKKPSR